MAGWGNDSFDAGAAGGWGDVSYSATEAGGEASRNYDKVSMPASIADLNQHVNPNDEKITYGKASFSTVRVAGIVKSSVEQDGGQSAEYRIIDDIGSAEDFLVIHYRGVNPNDITADLFVEGTMVVVVGKLRNFDKRSAIVAFDVREVEDKRELEAFRLEAKLAKLFYTKDILEKIKANPAPFENCMLRGNQSSGGQAEVGGAPALSNWGGPTNRTGANAPIRSGGVENVKGLVGQKAAIYNYLSNLGSVEGASLDEIKKHIPKNVHEPRNFEADFDSLLSEGHIYSTVDDDHFTAN